MASPAGLRSYNYAEAESVFRTRTQKWLLTIVLLLLLLSPMWLSSYWLGIASLTGITVIALTGLNIITGYSGQISLGHVGFMAIGGYLSAILTGRYNQPFAVGLLLAGLVAGAIGALFGLLPNKGKWHWAAAATLALQIIVLSIINLWPGMTGGTEGMAVPSPSIGFIDFNTPTGLYFLIMLVMVIAVFFANNMMKTRTGRAFTSVRDNPRTAAAMGINATRSKMLAFGIGCATAGVAGALMAHWTGFITSGTFSLADSVFFFGILIIGGMGTMWSPVRGALIFVLISRIFAPWLAGVNLLPSGQLSFWTVFDAWAIFIFATITAAFWWGNGWQIWKR